MKKLIYLSLFTAINFLPHYANAQYGATFTVATTANQGEIAIDYDLTGYSNFIYGPNIGLFWAEHQTSKYRKDIYLDSVNTLGTLNLTLLENGTYTYYSRLYTNTNFGEQDSVMGTITITNGLPSCGSSFTSTQNSSTQYDFNATSSFAGISGSPSYNWTKNPYEAVTMSFTGSSIGTTNPISYDFSSTYSGYHPYAVVMLTVNDANCHSTVLDNIDITGGCYAYFEIANTLNPAVILGSNLSYGNNLTYTWDFGDGGSSNLQYPTHTYSSVGWYTITLAVNDGAGCSHTWQGGVEIITKSGTEIIFVDPNTVSIHEKTIADLNIFPNPSNGEINVNFNSNENKKSTLSIIDIQGRTIYSEIHNIKDGANQLNLNLQNTESGIYFIQLDNQFLDKVIIE